MRIVMAVVSDLSSDARVRREAAALADAGHRVSVIGFDYQVRRPVRRDADGVVYRLLPFPARGSSRPRRLWGAARFFARASIAVLAARADAVHAHNLHLAVPCMLAARLRRARLVYDAHELAVPMVRRRHRGLAVRYERMIWRRADAIITTNQSRARFLSRLHGGRAPVVVGNYPVEPAVVRPDDLRRRLGVPADRRILLYQGGLYVDDRCFEAVATALQDLPEWHWVLVGFGSPRNLGRLAAILRVADLADRAHIVPKVPLDRLLDVSAGADLGVVPLKRVHLNNYLGDTNKLFEYLMAGVPAVGSDFPEVRRALIDSPEGPVGAVFDPADPASIALAIKHLEPDLPELRRRAWLVARSRFSWRLERAKVTRLYERLGTPGGTS